MRYPALTSLVKTAGQLWPPTQMHPWIQLQQTLARHQTINLQPSVDTKKTEGPSLFLLQLYPGMVKVVRLKLAPTFSKRLARALWGRVTLLPERKH